MRSIRRHGIRGQPASRFASTRAASDNVSHGSWIIIAVALGALLVGTLAIPGGPVHHWLTCNTDSITDISGSAVHSIACTGPSSSASTTTALLDSASLTFTDTWPSQDWAEMADSSTQSWPAQYGSDGLLPDSTGVVEDTTAGPSFKGTVGESALVRYQNPSATYTQFSFTGVSYNGDVDTATPVVDALVQSTPSAPITSEQVWSYTTNGYSQPTTPVRLTLPAHSIGVAWGLIGGGTAGFYDFGWQFVLQNPTLTS